MDAREMKDRSPGRSDDMSPEAVSRRRDIMAELYEFAMEMRRAKLIGPEDNEPDGDGAADDSPPDASPPA